MLDAAKRKDPRCAVILMTGRGTVETVMAATKGGATQTRDARPSDDALALVSQGTSPTADLRGQTGDDALAAVEAALDRAALSGQSHLVVVHGHGTGALRKRVRAYLADSPYVARWAPGASRQGGDGVSIVELR